MAYRLAADLVVVVHLSFVAFFLAGGFLAWRRRRVLRLHLAAVAASLVLAAGGLDCPLTDLEKALVRRAGETPYAGGFIEHYLVEPMYQAGMTPELRLGLRLFAVAVVVSAYAGLAVTRHSRLRLADSSEG